MNAVWISKGLQAEYEKENEKPSRGRKIQKQHFAMHFYTFKAQGKDAPILLQSL